MKSESRTNLTYSRFRYRRKLNKKHRQSWFGINCIIHLTLLAIFAIYFQHSQSSRRRLDWCREEDEYEDTAFLFEEYFTLTQLRNGAIVLHIVGILYAFLGLAIICDDYFEPTLEVICRRWDITPDVAGATFMAAGGSAPELATSLSGVLFAKSDIGFGTIIGSAVFNMLFVIAICALVAPGLKLTWWPLTRDSVFYSFSILVLSLTVMDDKVTLAESALLFSMYLVYIIIMKYNETIQKFVENQLRQEIHAPWRLLIRDFVSNIFFKIFMLVIIIMNFIFTLLEVLEEDSPSWSEGFNSACAVIYICEYILKSCAFGWLSYWRDVWNAMDGALVFLVIVEWLVNATVKTGALRVVRMFKVIRLFRSIRIVSSLEQTHHQMEEAVFKNDEKIQALLSSTESAGVGTPIENYDTAVESNSDGEEDSSDDHGPGPLLEWGESKTDKFWWAISFPYNLICYLTIPDSSKEHLEKYYVASFFISLFWIIMLSYFMVFMATTVGETMDIPAPVMGFTLLAAGTSITDLLTSRAVAARGYGDMAVSSSIGSNVFDILVGLALPWLVYTSFVDYGSGIEIKSHALVFMVISLLLMVGFVFLLIHYYGWTLNKNIAYTFTLLYFFYVSFCLFVEYGVLFGC